MDSEFQDKTAVIVGVEGGLGKAVAVHFAGLGCSLALLGVNQSELDEIVKLCVERGRHSKKVIAFSCSFQQESEIKSVFARTSELLGPFHILVNCAGSICYGRLSEMTPSTVTKVMQVNTLAITMATKEATAYLETKKGVVINISCSCAHRTSPSLIAFGMAMSSINYFTQSTAIELAPKGIRVNAVSPSVNVFESLLEAAPAEPYCEPRRAPLNQSPPTIDDVLKTITFLASDENSFITGEIICIDNGLHIAGVPF